MIKRTSIPVLTLLVFGFIFSTSSIAQNKQSCCDTTKKVAGKKTECCGDKCKDKTTEKGTASVKTWNKVCPVTGEELGAKTATLKYKGKTIGLCCPMCIKKFKSDPEKYMKKLSEDGSKYIAS